MATPTHGLRGRILHRPLNRVRVDGAAARERSHPDRTPSSHRLGNRGSAAVRHRSATSGGQTTATVFTAAGAYSAPASLITNPSEYLGAPRWLSRSLLSHPARCCCDLGAAFYRPVAWIPVGRGCSSANQDTVGVVAFRDSVARWRGRSTSQREAVARCIWARYRRGR